MTSKYTELTVTDSCQWGVHQVEVK